ncbi:DNA ligase-1 [Jatrophihabitans sp. GAS493]|uniref:ATP-dependent DNA ligase n=1 Tax=Jatrophihabitans sp. GAS493 TaxID=1907575 RepID=UPI000BB96A5B|nr:ATP-dependent DNA ligase [Jatrophihabitans sp. GAS493]SOD73860.1 DNA ligase-1 [Jatrophihabitans sp. GAS493]
MLFASVATASLQLAGEPGRLKKTALLAELLRGLEPTEIEPAVAWLSGELLQGQIGVGWAALRTIPAAGDEPVLAIGDVQQALDSIATISGAGSRAARAAELTRLFGAATAHEQNFLRRLIGGELRQGALGALMLDAVAAAAEVPITAVRRAAMLHGDTPAIARLALLGGVTEVGAVGLEVGRAVAPMLAKPGGSIVDAIARLGLAGWEQKLDGARIQVHRDGENVLIFTRSLDEITDRLPEIVELARRLGATRFVLDGEVLLLRPDGRPHPFQVTAARFASGNSAEAEAAATLTPFFFDLLHLDGVDLIDEPAATRIEALEGLVPAQYRPRRVVTADAEVASAFFEDVVASGHEGVVAKSLSASYEAGRRGDSWLKIKPVHTLDLVVLAVEWGSGRRTGLLSNIHLGARAADGGFVMLGKTFKGMTDAMLQWQTERFRELAATPLEQRVVALRPEQVVEVAIDGVQRSTRYPGGVALRFARVLRYRDDKPVSEIDTVESVQAMLG